MECRLMRDLIVDRTTVDRNDTSSKRHLIEIRFDRNGIFIETAFLSKRHLIE